MILALTFGLIANVVNAVDLTAGLVGYWPLNSNATDRIGSHNGTLEGGARTVADAKRGRVLSLDGVDDYVNIPDSTDFDITSDFTVAFWMKLPKAFDSSSDTSRPPIGKFGSNDYQMLFTLVGAGYTAGIPAGMLPSQGSMAFKLEDKSVGNSFFYASTSMTSWETNTWYHVLGIYKDSDVTGHIYVDGELQGSTKTNDSTSALLEQVGGPIEIGRCQLEQVGGSINHFDGLIDDVVIYNRALDSDEIQVLANGAIIFAVNPAARLTTTWAAIKH